MTSLTEWAKIIANALATGLGTDDELVHFEPLPVPKIDVTPSGVLYPGGRSRRFYDNSDEGSGFSLRHVEWTALLVLGEPDTTEAFELFYEWSDLLEPALRLCLNDPDNVGGGYPDLGLVSMPFNHSIGGVNYLCSVADLSHSIYVE